LEFFYILYYKMESFDKLEAALRKADISKDKIKNIIKSRMISDDDMKNLMTYDKPEDAVIINFESSEMLDAADASKLFNAWNSLYGFDKLEAALRNANIGEDKIREIIDWGMIDDNDMKNLMEYGDPENAVIKNFESSEMLDEAESSRLFKAWNSLNGGGKLKHRRRINSKRKKSKKGKSNRRRKRKTRRRSKKRS
jgi:hypothetical protein